MSSPPAFEAERKDEDSNTVVDSKMLPSESREVVGWSQVLASKPALQQIDHNWTTLVKEQPMEVIFKPGGNAMVEALKIGKKDPSISISMVYQTLASSMSDMGAWIPSKRTFREHSLNDSGHMCKKGKPVLFGEDYLGALVLVAKATDWEKTAAQIADGLYQKIVICRRAFSKLKIGKEDVEGLPEFELSNGSVHGAVLEAIRFMTMAKEVSQIQTTKSCDSIQVSHRPLIAFVSMQDQELVMKDTETNASNAMDEFSGSRSSLRLGGMPKAPNVLQLVGTHVGVVQGNNPQQMFYWQGNQNDLELQRMRDEKDVKMQSIQKEERLESQRMREEKDLKMQSMLFQAFAKKDEAASEERKAEKEERKENQQVLLDLAQKNNVGITETQKL
ncbi:MAG: hypothetical protein SGARI_004670, partial [Bacillariaceae sp.]